MVRRSWMWVVLQAVCRIGVTLMFDLKVYGRRHVPRTGGALLVANHQSFLDPVLVAVALYRPVSFFARSELFENPFFGWLIRSLRAFPVRQGKADKAAMQMAIDRLRAGEILNVYPEGTRTPDGEIHAVQPGVALMVRRAGVPVVPVVVDGSFEAWPRKHKLFRPYPIRVMYGPAMNVDGLSASEVISLIESRLKQMLAELRGKRGKR